MSVGDKHTSKDTFHKDDYKLASEQEDHHPIPDILEQAVATKPTGGIKNDSMKVQFELLSRMWLAGTAAVLTHGAKKYSADNWRLGMNRRRLMGAALRHMFAYLDGEDLDPETGMNHLYHASCELMFMAELHETMPQTDDRFKVDKEAMSKLLAQIDECLRKIPPKQQT